METTPRLGLWTLSPGQAQKETSINEGLHLLDAIIAGAVEEPARSDPPATPAVGTSFIIADQATGEWAGHDGALAAFTPGGWRYVAATAGLTVLEKSDWISASIPRRCVGADPWSASAVHSGCHRRLNYGCGISRDDFGHPECATGARS